MDAYGSEPRHNLDADDTIDADTLLGMVFAPLIYVVPGYVVEGLTVLGGKPKTGKSWWAYDVAIAVATGDPAMGKVDCKQGDVLYLALEDNRRRIKDRINTLRPLGKKRGGLLHLSIRTRAPRIRGTASTRLHLPILCQIRVYFGCSEKRAGLDER